MAGLLVSVRSAAEAASALAGGASVVDIKEPDRGPLGRADPSVWRAVRAVVPPDVPLSVALGELADWDGTLDPDTFVGIAFRKIGPAGLGDGDGSAWPAAWAAIREADRGGPPWIAVAYADWRSARAPRPEAVLDAALAASDCVGVLVDTHDKARLVAIDTGWSAWVDRARRGGKLVALAGGLDAAGMARLAPLGPDLFAVRGAACLGGDRRAAIDPDRVADLVRVARGGPR